MCPEKSMDTLCELFGKTRQAYYQRMNYDYIEQSEDGIIVDMVMDIRQSMGKIGGRKLWHLLNEAYPGLIGRDRLYDLLERHNLKISKRKRAVRTTWSAAWMRRFDDLTKGLILTAANQLWVSDITYIRTIKGFLYLHLVTDAYSKKIMGWCLSENLNADHTKRITDGHTQRRMRPDRSHPSLRPWVSVLLRTVCKAIAGQKYIHQHDSRR